MSSKLNVEGQTKHLLEQSRRGSPQLREVTIQMPPMNTKQQLIVRKQSNMENQVVALLCYWGLGCPVTELGASEGAKTNPSPPEGVSTPILNSPSISMSRLPFD